MNTLEKLKADEAEAEAMFNAPSQVPVAPQAQEIAEPIDQTQDELDAAQYMEDAIIAPQHEEDTLDEPEYEEAEDVVPEKKSRTNWKRRFTNFKASADTTIYELRQEVSGLQRALASAKEDVMKLREATPSTQTDVFDGVFSEDEEATFGTEGLDIVKKATKTAIDNATKPLKDQLNKVEKDRIDSLRNKAMTAKKMAYGKFIGDLEALVPNYAEVNVDRGFLEWMKSPDRYSGITRANLFTAAEEAGDAGRVAEFFVEYSQLRSTPTKPKSEIDRHITPVGGGSASSTPRSTKGTNSQPVYQSEINAFYDAVAKGHYAGRHDEVLAIEAEIDLALLEGRIKQG